MEKQNIQRFTEGLNTDQSPSDQPKNSTRFVLNGVAENDVGDMGFITVEESNEAAIELPLNFVPIGQVTISEDETILFLVADYVSVGISVSGNSIIGLKTKDTFEILVQTDVLNFNIEKQIEATYRLRRGCERVVYWTDDLNPPRMFNLDKPENFKTLGAWVADKFRIQKLYSSIPIFDNIEIQENGNILPGSYNAAIQYLDEDLNPTEWITTSDIIIIYNSSTGQDYSEIEGSTGADTFYQDFGPTNKSIRFTFTNLDEDFPYYRVAIIEASSGTGETTNVSLSDYISTKYQYYVYTGNNIGTITENEILQIKEFIATAKHIEQIDNRLLLGNTKGKQVNNCKFQKYASQITAQLITKEISMSDVKEDCNPKSGEVYFDGTGYQPGEIYSFGIVYIFKDGTQSPVFHIPGSTPEYIAALPVNDRMSNDNELANTTYENPAGCTEDYWGDDYDGNALDGINVRHHRFPLRSELPGGHHAKESYRKVMNTTSQQVWAVELNVDECKISGVRLELSYQNSVAVPLGPVIIDIPIVNTSTGPEFYYFFEENYADAGSLHLSQVRIDEGAGFAANVFPGGGIPDLNINGVTGSGNTSFDVTASARIIYTYEQTYYNNILGIKFGNINKPLEYEGDDEVVGYYIVRNERTEEHKTILDTCILLPLIDEGNYVGFGNILPDVNTSVIKKDMYALFHPQNGFKYREYTNVDEFILQSYTENPSGGDDLEFSTSKITQDVMAGTTYDPDISKNREYDADGFSLHTYSKISGHDYDSGDALSISNIDEIFYLNALTSKTTVDSAAARKQIYNVSADNRIGIVKLDANVDLTASPYYMLGDGINHYDRSLLFVMKRHLTDPYSNYRTLPYYKESTNYFETGTLPVETELYAGDCFPSFMNFSSACYYDTKLKFRTAKKGVLEIVLGVLSLVAAAVLAVLSVAGSVFSGGATALIGGTVVPSLVGVGLSFLKSGITQNAVAKAFVQDYEDGLRDTIDDTELAAEFVDEPEDDEIRWFQKIWKNIFFEGQININLRQGSTYIDSFLNSQTVKMTETDLDMYMLEKLTVLDTSYGDGRLFQGLANPEFYEINADYERGNKQKVFFHLPFEYDCCSLCLETFPHRVFYSEQSFQEELADNYKIFLPNNYRDVEGETGRITNMFKIQNNLYIHTENALWHLPQNFQERVTGDIISFIGTGEYFNIPPRKIVDSNNMSAGTQHKWGFIKTPYGVFFPCYNERKMYLFNGNNLKEISNKGEFNWFKENMSFVLNDQYVLDNDTREYEYINNPSNAIGIGYITSYDSRKQRIIITKKDMILSSELNTDYRLYYYGGDYYIFTNYQATIDTYVALEYVYYGIYSDVVTPTPYMVFKKVDKSDLSTLLEVKIYPFLSPDIFEGNASWTKSYSLKPSAWISYHSYLPSFYISENNNFYSWLQNDQNLWKHNKKGHYQTFYNTRGPFIIEYVSLSTPIVTRILDYLKFLTTAEQFDIDRDQFFDKRFITFNKLIAYNSHQCTGELTLTVKDTSINPVNYLLEQIKDISNESMIDRNERDWTVNDLRDIVINQTEPLFNSKLSDIQSNYFIDKILNFNVLDFNKDWSELEIFRDKYLVIRLIFDNFENVKLTMNYAIENEIPSFR